MHYTPNWQSIDSRPIPSWFQQAKFGIFIHWGVYSVPAWRKLESERYASYAEWYYARVIYNEENGGKAFHETNYGANFEYRDFAPLFKAELFDATFFADLIAQSGAKYAVLTSKHHDGYCLWPASNKYKQNWNSVNIGPKRDLVGELSTAIKNKGLKMGLYYSIIEWESTPTHRTESGYFLPDALIQKYQIPADTYVNEVLIPELKELVNRYEPSLIFSDGGEWDLDENYVQTKEFLSWLYEESPVKNEIVVNDRFHKGMPGVYGDYYSSEYNDAEHIQNDHPWEESRGIGDSYGFNRAENWNHYNSTKDLILELVDIVSRGGNLLLNIGPAADGTIPVVMQERLIEIGQWLHVNGEGIYNTHKHTIKQLLLEDQQLYFTKNEEILFVFFTKWKESISFEYSLLAPTSIEILGTHISLKWKLENNKLTIDIPRLTIDELPCIHLWGVRIKITD
ncbi:MAG: alpha-L-fucosidase [Crocinitomicaceae bacterium]|nr:alpha-L-fucosidase [Crocinitomicaceae bacterium]